MHFHPWILILLLYACCIHFIISFELLSTIVVGISSVVYNTPFCFIKECCNENEIPGDIKKLERLLHEKVYGQHLAVDVVVNSLRSHWNEHTQPPKALTLSFHGWPGGGKNYISGFIKESLYKQGGKSQFVHHFISRIHFPQAQKVEEYKLQLYQWIKGNVTACAKSLFIFDEVNLMPPGLLNIIKPIIDYNDRIDRIDFRRSIFIFLSNTGESLITEKAIELWQNGVMRKNIRLQDFESIITMGAFNEGGGLHHSDNIKSNLIDHYIPFLPLEMEHVRLCILDQFRSRGVNNPDERYIKEVMNFVEFGPDPHKLFSKTGCKRLSQKVAMVVEMYSLRTSTSIDYGY